MKKYQAIIIGYGPTGAVLAYLLGKQKIRTLVLEANSELINTPRAVHLDGETMRIFQSLNLHREVESCSRSDIELTFINDKDRILHQQDFSKVDQVNGWPNDFLFWQPALESAIRDRVCKLENVDVRQGWTMKSLKIAGEEVFVEAFNANNKEVFSSKYVLGCDGASSHTRKILDINQNNLGSEEPWLVCDLLLPKDIEVNNMAYQVCNPSRPLTIVPCNSNHIRWEFMLKHDDNLSTIANDNSVRALMSPHIKRLNKNLGTKDGVIIRSNVYKFHSLVAKYFNKERVFLLGDAAHQMPPFLGQGMCAGIRDAYNLSWKLGGVLNYGWNESILNSYESERKPHVTEVIKKAIKIGDVLQTKNRFAAFMRDIILKLGRIFPFFIANLNFVSGWRLGDGIFFNDKNNLNRYLIRQSTIRLKSGKEKKLDSLLGRNFSIVCFDIDPSELLSLEITNYFQSKLNYVIIGKNGHGYDVDGYLSSWAKKYSIGVVILRPDKQIYSICYRNTELSYKEQFVIQLKNLKYQLSNS